MKEKKVNKKPRATSVAAIKLGGEPKLLVPNKLDLAKALNWYNAVAQDADQRVAWVVEFMETQGHYSREEIAEFKRRGKKFIWTFSALARMHNNGCAIEDRHLDTLNQEIAKFIGKNAIGEDELALDDEGQVIVTTPVKSIKRDRTGLITNKLVEVIDFNMDRVIAGEKVGSMYEVLVKNGVTAAAARELKAFYKPQAFEFYQLNDGKDAQLNEGYSFMTKKVRRAMCDWMMQLIADLAKLEANKKVVRAPRKKRAPKVENLVKRVKYCKESVEYKVKSISPTAIVGAKALWVFNTKTRQIGCYNAKDQNGLSVKGTTVVNGSGEMKKLRHPEQFLSSFSGTKASLDNKFKAINAAAVSMNGRINEHIILLKVFS